MKALGVDAIPSGEWRCEVKFDGYRAVAVINSGHVEVWSRNYKLLTADYPEVVASLHKIRCKDAVIDGEIVALDSEGRTRFQLLQGREISGARPPIVYYVFDIMHLNGGSLLKLPIEERREKLEKLINRPSKTLQLSPVFDVAPQTMMTEVRKNGLEGMVGKKPGSLYEPNRRSGAWVKVKIVNEQEFVIGGFTPPRKSRKYFGALLVGYYDEGKLMYAGKVGSGFDFKLLKSLHGAFASRLRTDCPFVNLPMPRRPRFGQGMTRSEMQKVTWIEPEMVAQIRFAEWTHEGLLRQPVFLGLREDKNPKEVRREAPSVHRDPK